MSREASGAGDIQTSQSAPIVNPLVAARAAERPDSGTADFSFDDVIDTINPLQHLPLISSIYRAVTGDKISGMARILGDTLYGGPMGLLTSAIDAVIEQADGQDIESQAIAWVTGDDDAGTPAKTATDGPATAAKAVPETAPKLTPKLTPRTAVAGAGGASFRHSSMPGGQNSWNATLSTAPRSSAPQLSGLLPAAGSSARVLDDAAGADAQIAQIRAAAGSAANHRPAGDAVGHNTAGVGRPVKSTALRTSLPTGTGKYFPAPARNTDPTFGTRPPPQIPGMLASRAAMLGRLAAAAHMPPPNTAGTATAAPAIGRTIPPLAEHEKAAVSNRPESAAHRRLPATPAKTAAAAPANARHPAPHPSVAATTAAESATMTDTATRTAGTVATAAPRHVAGPTERTAPSTTGTAPAATASASPAAGATATAATGPGDWPAGGPTPLPKQLIAGAMMMALQKYQAMQQASASQSHDDAADRAVDHNY